MLELSRAPATERGRAHRKNRPSLFPRSPSFLARGISGCAALARKIEYFNYRRVSSLWIGKNMSPFARVGNIFKMWVNTNGAYLSNTVYQWFTCGSFEFWVNLTLEMTVALLYDWITVLDFKLSRPWEVMILVFREQSCSCCTCTLHLYFGPSSFRRRCSLLGENTPETNCKRKVQRQQLHDCPRKTISIINQS